MLAGVGRSGGDLVGEGLFHSAVHLPPQLPGPIGRARPCGQHCPHPGRMGQLIPIAGGTDFQLAQQLLSDGTQAVLCKGTEHDELIQPPHQLGPEPLLGFLNGLGRLFLEHGLAARCKAQRGALPGQKACPQIGGEQDDGIAEIGLAAHGIGELAVFQDLQQNILDVRVGLFDLVKEHHAVRAAADGFGELAALIVAKVARRRAQQAGCGVLLLILRHIELEQSFFAAEPAGGKGLGKGGLAHAGGPQKEHGPHGAARLPQPGAAAPDGPGHRRHGLLLAHDLGIEAGFQLVQPFPFLLPHPLHGHAAGLRHHPGNVLPGEGGICFSLPLGTDAGSGTGLVHKVDGLIGQEAPRQVPHRELHGLPQRLRRQMHAVVPLVAGGKALQDRRGLRRGRLLDLHPAKAALQCGILLDMGAELLIGGGPDELQLPPGQHGLQDAGGINGPLCRAGSHDGVELVHKQDGAAVPHKLLQKGLEPLLKVAPVLGARHKAGHIQRQQPPSLQHPGHIPAGDALGKALGKGRFAHARLPHQTGVILLAAAQDLHHPVQLRIPAEHRVQLAVHRAAGQVAAILIAGAAAPGHGAGPGRAGQDELPRDLAALPHGLGQLHPHGGQQHPRRAVGILQHGAEQVLRLRLGQVGVLCPDEGIIHGPAQVRGQRLSVQLAGRAGAALGQLTAHGGLGDVLARQKPPCRAAVSLQHGKQQMPGIRPGTAHAARKLHGFVQQQPCLPRKPLVSAHAECFPNAHALLLAVLFHTQQSIGPVNGKKSVVFVGPQRQSFGAQPPSRLRRQPP